MTPRSGDFLTTRTSGVATDLSGLYARPDAKVARGGAHARPRSSRARHGVLRLDRKWPVAKIEVNGIEEKLSGANRDRPQLNAALDYVRAGDTLVVWTLDRIARSLKQLIETVEMLSEREIGFRSLTENIDSTSSGGRLIFHIFGALAKFERSIIRERTTAGLTAARSRSHDQPLTSLCASSHAYRRQCAHQASSSCCTRYQVPPTPKSAQPTPIKGPLATRRARLADRTKVRPSRGQTLRKEPLLQKNITNFGTSWRGIPLDGKPHGGPHGGMRHEKKSGNKLLEYDGCDAAGPRYFNGNPVRGR